MKTARCDECGTIGPAGKTCDHCGRERRRNHHMGWAALLAMLLYAAVAVVRHMPATREEQDTKQTRVSPVGELLEDGARYRDVVAAISKHPDKVVFSDERISARDPSVRCGTAREGESVWAGTPRARRFVVVRPFVIIEDDASALFQAAWQRNCDDAPDKGRVNAGR